MKRILSLLLVCIMLFSVCVVPVFASDTLNESDAPLVDNDPSLNAYAAIVLDMETGNVLYEYDADEKNYPASCTKIMTAYLCLKYGNVNDTVTVSSSAFSDISSLASTWDFKVGEEMSVLQLLKCLLVVSASEGANVVAEYISGSIDEFVELMNEEAAALGCENTHFVNCHGLPRSQHYTTARDLATIAMAAMEYPLFRNIVGSAITNLEATNYHSAMSILTTNGLLPGSTEYGGKYNYPYAIGIKTGHTSVAGYNLVSAANKDGHEILTVVMGCSTRESSFSQTVKLFDWAYDNYEVLTWDWSDHASADTPELPDAPEYEEVETSSEDDTEEVIILSEEGNPLEEGTAEATSPVEESTEPNETAESGTPADSQDNTSVNTATSSSISSSMRPALISFGIAFLLIIVLIIVLVVVLVRHIRR